MVGVAHVQPQSPRAHPALLQLAKEWPIVLIPSTAPCLDLDDGSDQGTAWRTNAFDDQNWKTRQAEFGHGDGEEATYFRHPFYLSNTGSFTALAMRLFHDDDVVAY